MYALDRLCIFVWCDPEICSSWSYATPFLDTPLAKMYASWYWLVLTYIDKSIQLEIISQHIQLNFTSYLRNKENGLFSGQLQERRQKQPLFR